MNASSKIKEGLVLPSFPLSSSLSKRARSDVATTTFCEWFFYRVRNKGRGRTFDDFVCTGVREISIFCFVI